VEIQNILQQIDRFRTSAYRTLGVLAGFSILSYFFAEQILKFLRRPLGQPLAFFSPGEAFIAHIKIAVFSGLFLSAPYLLHQIWIAFSSLAFKEGRRYTWILVLMASLLFLAGSTLGYTLVLPFGLKFLLGFGTTQIRPVISVDRYVSFMATLILIFGFCFQLPLILLALGQVGLVDSRKLSHFRKYAILLITIFSAIITPTPDAYTMLLLMVPLVFLYEISIILLWFFGRKKASPSR